MPISDLRISIFSLEKISVICSGLFHVYAITSHYPFRDILKELYRNPFTGSLSFSVPECARCNVRGELIRHRWGLITFIYEIKIAQFECIHIEITKAPSDRYSHSYRYKTVHLYWKRERDRERYAGEQALRICVIKTVIMLVLI